MRTNETRFRRMRWRWVAAHRTAVAWIGLATVVGLGLRLWKIGALGDLDFDEQASAFIGSMDPPSMLRYLARAPFEHPPVFYLLFHGWIHLFGLSETAMRLFAVVPGTLAVLVVGIGVLRVAGRRAGVVAAFILAVSPLQVFESRDARMYSLLALLMSVLVLTLTSAITAGSGGGWTWRGVRAAGAPVLIGGLALATHYYALFGLLGAVLGALLAWRSEHRSTSGPSLKLLHTPLVAMWITVPAIALVFGVVWLLASPGFRLSLSVAYPRWVDPHGLGVAILASFGASLAGPLLNGDESAVVGIGTALVAGAAAWAVFSDGVRVPIEAPGGEPGLKESAQSALHPALSPDGADTMAKIALCGFVVSSIAVPLLMILGRAYAPRFVALASPFLAILIGVAASRLASRWALVLVGCIAVAAAPGLVPLYTGYVRSDYGRALAALRAEARPDDAIVLNGPWQDLLYQRYGWGLPPRSIIASTVPLKPEEAIDALRQLTSGHPRLWVVDSATDDADPTGVVATWLDQHAYPRPVIPFEKALLRPYLTDAYPGKLEDHSVNLALVGLRVSDIAIDRWDARPGDEIRLRIRGQREAKDPPATGLWVELASSNGASVWHWDGALAGSGTGVEYRAAILLPASVPPGPYTLDGVAYAAVTDADGNRSVAWISDPVSLATIDVRPR